MVTSWLDADFLRFTSHIVVDRAALHSRRCDAKNALDAMENLVRRHTLREGNRRGIQASLLQRHLQSFIRGLFNRRKCIQREIAQSVRAQDGQEILIGQPENERTQQGRQEENEQAIKDVLEKSFRAYCRVISIKI